MSPLNVPARRSYPVIAATRGDHLYLVIVGPGQARLYDHAKRQLHELEMNHHAFLKFGYFEEPDLTPEETDAILAEVERQLPLVPPRPPRSP